MYPIIHLGMELRGRAAESESKPELGAELEKVKTGDSDSGPRSQTAFRPWPLVMPTPPPPVADTITGCPRKKRSVIGTAVTNVFMVASTPNFALSNNEPLLAKLFSFIIMASFSQILSTEKPAFRIRIDREAGLIDFLQHIVGRGIRSSFDQCINAALVDPNLQPYKLSAR